ncbi:MAG: YbaB/EbfC family nucleoid-associated protein [Rickettsiaceae bacterium]|nr:YbaB/EbfC family nucleoid-associated protein [Rickettsiaceae bacterium]
MNFNTMLKQAQIMQQKMEEIKSQVANAEYEGKSGAGLVKISINGSGRIKSLSLDASILKPEEKEVVEDLVIAAFNDAKDRLDQDSKEKMSSAMSGFGLPEGMKFPF